MSYTQLAYAHLATVGPAFVIGTVLMIRRKGTPHHRFWGKLYMALMVATASISLLMPAVVGPRLLNHFGFIHLFSILTLVSVPQALWAARSHNVKAHRSAMIGLYIGGLLIAGGFALMPGRMLHNWAVAFFRFFA